MKYYIHLIGIEGIQGTELLNSLYRRILKDPDKDNYIIPIDSLEPLMTLLNNE